MTNESEKTSISRTPVRKNESEKSGMPRPPMRTNPPVPNHDDRAKRFEYTNIDDLFGEVEHKPDPVLDKSITVRQATIVALEQCKSIFEHNGVLWNQAINAVVNALEQYAREN